MYFPLTKKQLELHKSGGKEQTVLNFMLRLDSTLMYAYVVILRRNNERDVVREIYSCH